MTLLTHSCPYPPFCIHRFNQPWITQYYSIYCWEKNPPISGPAQFKPMLFKGQLYNKQLHSRFFMMPFEMRNIIIPHLL